MEAQRAKLLNSLPEHGWRLVSEEGNLEWWADEIWKLESIWSPVGAVAFVTFLVDPMYDGSRQKGEGVWAVMASQGRPIVPSHIQDEVLTFRLGRGWADKLPALFDHLSAIRNDGL
jgi:hypothetical protein